MGNGHAMLSPSGAARWMACPGSVALSQGLPDESSEYADEGTAAHFLAALCLKTHTDPVAYVNLDILVGALRDGTGDWSGFANGKVPEIKVRHRFKVQPEMIQAVRKYVNGVAEDSKGADLQVEVSVPLEHLTAEKDATGTADAMWAHDDVLEIRDLKYGQGVEVSPDNNEQMLMYALGALPLVDFIYDIKRVRIGIHQPRVRADAAVAEYGIEEVKAFGEKIKKAAADAMIALEFRDNWIDGPDYSWLRPGEKQCQFCKARSDCPALDAKVQEDVGATFTQIVESPADKEHVEQGIAAHDAHLLGLKMAACDLIEIWIKAVRAEVERRLIAGQKVPGFKLVQGRQGNRKWTDNAEVEALMKKMRLTVEQMYDLSLISPTTAEKLHESGAIGPKQWPKFEAFITRAAGKPSVAPDGDKRAALPAVGDEFTATVTAAPEPKAEDFI